MELQNEHKPRKRIISKSHYARQVGGKVLATSAGTFIIFIGVTMLAFGLFLVYMLSSSIATYMPPFFKHLVYLSLPLIFIYSASALMVGWQETKKAVKVPLDLPLTRGAIEYLPPEESLVRGASEPTQQQQAVLLRATQTYHTTPAEQLLRAGQSETERE